MASHCCAGLLPIPCCARQHDSVAHLSTTCQPAVAECPHPAQSASTGAVGATYSTVEPMGSPTSRPASLSRRTLLRHSSFVRAVCVDALVRICAGGYQQWSSLPRQLRWLPGGDGEGCHIGRRPSSMPSAASASRAARALPVAGLRG